MSRTIMSQPLLIILDFLFIVILIDKTLARSPGFQTNRDLG